MKKIKNNKNLLFLLVLVILLVFYYFYRGNNKGAVISELIAVKELGQFASKINRKNLEAQITMIPKVSPYGCMLGDWDALEFSLHSVPERGMIATLERLDRKKTKPQFFTIAKKNLVKKMNFKFLVPKTDELSLWGFFVCNDSGQEKSCQNKKLKNINEVLKNLFYLRKNGDAAKIDDSIFIFQMLLVIDNYIFYLKNPQKDLLFLKEVFSGLSLGKNYLATIESADEVNKNIFSNTFNLKDRKFLTLDVPGVNRKLCKHIFR